MLEFPGNVVFLVPALQSGSGLVVVETYIIFNALHVHIDHPGIVPPFVCILMEEIGRKAGEDMASGRKLVHSLILAAAVTADRQIEALGFPDHSRILANLMVAPPR